MVDTIILDRMCCRGFLVHVLEGAHHILDVVMDGEGPGTFWHLDKVVDMVRGSHEPGERRVTEDGVVGQADACHLEVEGLGAAVLARAEGGRKTYSPQGNRGAVCGSKRMAL